jgi:hypothetical protein
MKPSARIEGQNLTALQAKADRASRPQDERVASVPPKKVRRDQPVLLQANGYPARQGHKTRSSAVRSANT